jgi:branched-chain amino acid transport system substrate-binding protein
MDQQRISTRRRNLMLGAAAAGATALTHPLSVLAQGSEEIVIGGSIPMTGVFAFAGVGINAGIQDYVKIVNDAGGIKGRKVKYVPEDTGYKVDVSVATFKKITSQNKVNVYYGDSTGFAKTINPELDRNGNILMAGASFASELNDPKKYPHQFLVGPDYTEMFGILLKHIAKEKPGAKVAFVYSDSEFGRDPIEKSEAAAKALGLSVPIKIMTPAGSVDVSTEVIKLRRAAPDYTIFHGTSSRPSPSSSPRQAARHDQQVDGHLLDHGQLHRHEDGPGRRRLHGRDALPLLLRHREGAHAGEDPRHAPGIPEHGLHPGLPGRHAVP